MRNTYLVCISVLAMSVGCDNSLTPGTPQPFQFPSTVGSFWHYSIVMQGSLDTTNAHPDCNFEGTELEFGCRDTVTISVVGTDTNTATDELVQVLRFSHRLDSVGYWFEQLWMTDGSPMDSNSPIVFYVYDSEYRAFYFERPLVDGATWLCTDCWYYSLPEYQRYSVEPVARVETKAGAFSGVIKVTHQYSCGDECGGLFTYWLKSGVGIVKLGQSLFTGGSPCASSESYSEWELVEYQIVP